MEIRVEVDMTRCGSICAARDIHIISTYIKCGTVGADAFPRFFGAINVFRAIGDMVECSRDNRTHPHVCSRLNDSTLQVFSRQLSYVVCV